MLLLEKTIETNNSFNQQIVSELNIQDAVMKQMIHNLYAFVHVRIKMIDQHEKLKSLDMRLQNHFTKPDLKLWKENKLSKLKKVKKALKSANFSYSDSKIKSEPFSATATESSYEEHLERVLSTVSSENGVVGSINLPQHVLGFQYSTDGYFLYDSMNSTTGGLLKYPDKETFFQQMRKQILDDIKTANLNKDASVRFEVIPLSG